MAVSNKSHGSKKKKKKKMEMREKRREMDVLFCTFIGGDFEFICRTMNI